VVDFIVSYWAVALVAGVTGRLIYKLRMMRKDVETELSQNTAKKIAALRADGRPKATELADEENELEENYNIELRAHRFKHSALNVFFVSIALIVCAYLMKFGGRPFSGDPEQWGQMGDFFGGMLNPVLAFASFMALLYTVKVQSEELRLTREELTKSSAAQQKSADSQIKQLKLQKQLEEFKAINSVYLNYINLAEEQYRTKIGPRGSLVELVDEVSLAKGEIDGLLFKKIVQESHLKKRDDVFNRAQLFAKNIMSAKIQFEKLVTLSSKMDEGFDLSINGVKSCPVPQATQKNSILSL